MAITFVAAGTVACSASGNATPGLPAGFAAGDVHITLASASDNIACTQTGFTSKQAVNNGTICRQTILYRIAQAGDTAQAVSHAAGDTLLARTFGFRGCVGAGDPVEAINGGSTGTGKTSTAATITPTSPGAAVVMLLTWTSADTSNNGTTASYSGTNPVFAEIGDNLSVAPGPGTNECDMAVAWGLDTDASATGSRTAVYTNATGVTVNWVATLLALTPAAAGSGRPQAPIIPFMH